MIIVSLPIGSAHGWGVCGKYLTREIYRLTQGQARLLTQSFNAETAGDELEFNALSAALITQQDVNAAQFQNGIHQFSCPLLTCIGSKQMDHWQPALRGRPTVGYTFFEDNLLRPEWIEAGRRNFDIIATGSSWNAKVLKEFGLSNVYPALQGIDPLIFYPFAEPGAAREFLADRFVIFSGGKFEFRKGQDIVIRAVKVMQQRHPDVFLINAWYNAWQASFDSMKASPYLSWPAASGNYGEIMSRILAHNGLDLSRVMILGPRTNALMARVYRNSDVGLFPNRCEGGTNLVMMEYMACGKPVVATGVTGHSDIVHDKNAYLINTPLEALHNDAAGQPVARWPEPSLDDAIDKLEEAYQNRSALRTKGAQAGADLSRFTWTHSAKGFLRLLTGDPWL
ncbi:MAG TPA: glycosyltransferase family 4 protein [Phycisphaerae bacterium]|jgi:glycosyltransferase involved in cell wall biosynthesis|nr:glycosyltransferase family 4 protein [Phycisphaerae bacterium]